MRFKCLDRKLIKCCCKNYGWRLVDQLKHFKAVYFWHLNIKKDKIGLMLLNCFHSFKTITAFGNNFQVGMFLQILIHNTSCERLIIYQNYFTHAAGSLQWLQKY